MWPFTSKKEPKPWERRREDLVEIEEPVEIEREPTVWYKIEVSTTKDTYEFESEKPIVMLEEPDKVTFTIAEGDNEGKITFYKRNLEFVQEYAPQRE